MPDHLHALPTGHLLDEYRINGVLGSGGFGITYLAWDTHLDKPVAIKEYLPGEFALRTDATTVKPKSTADQDAYQWGLERFLDEARALARFDHPHLNEVYRFLEGNGTAYMVLEYIEGETLAALLKREGQLDPARLRRLLDELLSGLEEVHAAGYVHRDVKPGNIMFRKDGAAVLLDFGAARQAIGQRSKSITSILTPGYAPIEQYDQNATDVGPWTDLYALGMVAYRCLSGINDSQLPDAVTRSRLERKGEQHKDLAPAVEVGKGRHSQALLEAVDWAMQVNEEQRPQSIAAMRETLGGHAAPMAATPDAKRHDQEAHTPPAPVRVRRNAKPMQPVEEFCDGEQCPQMVVLPAGSYMMGSPSDEEGRDTDEGPQHLVTIAKPFAVGKYPVTRAEFAHFVSVTRRWRFTWGSSVFSRIATRPAVNVSWEKAKAYVAWLSDITDKAYRLLSESEWEYAARAGTTTPFHFGDTISTDQANYNGNYIYGSGHKGVNRWATIPVGSFPANHFGLHDMHGNVWEWVEDCWHDSYAGAPADGSAWTRGGNCGARVLRGGSWFDLPWYLRSAYRLRITTGNRYSHVGFRVARTLTP